MPVTTDLLAKIGKYEKEGYSIDDIVSGLEQSTNYPDVAQKIKSYRSQYSTSDILSGIKSSPVIDQTPEDRERTNIKDTILQNAEAPGFLDSIKQALKPEGTEKPKGTDLRVPMGELIGADKIPPLQWTEPERKPERKPETKPIQEILKSGLRGVESIGAGVGSIMSAGGELMEFLSNAPTPGEQKRTESVQKIFGKVKEYGDVVNKYWTEEMKTGIAAPNPELFKGSFTENPSFTRASAIIAAAVPSLGAATVISIATGSPIAGALFLGSMEGSEQYSESRGKGKSVLYSTTIGGLSTIGNTVLEIIPITRFMKGGAGKLKKDIFIGAIQEGSEEVLQSLWTNTIAKIGYDKTRELTEGMVEGLIGGAGSGGVLGGLTSGRGMRTDKLITEATQSGVSPEEINAMQEAVKNQIVSNADKVEEAITKSAEKSKVTEFAVKKEPVTPSATEKVTDITQPHKIVGIDADTGKPIIKMGVEPTLSPEVTKPIETPTTPAVTTETDKIPAITPAKAVSEAEQAKAGEVVKQPPELGPLDKIVDTFTRKQTGGTELTRILKNKSIATQFLPREQKSSLTLYHGGSIDDINSYLDKGIETKGIIRATGSRRNVISLTPDFSLAKRFGKQGHLQRQRQFVEGVSPAIILKVKVPVQDLSPDTHQINNARLWKKIDAKNTLGDSLIHGKSAVVKEKIYPNEIESIFVYDNNKKDFVEVPFTREAIEDFYKQVNQSTQPPAEAEKPKVVKEPLAAEARKYKSAEEFVKAQENKKLYHGTSEEFDVFDVKKAHDVEGKKLGLGWGRGVLNFTTSKGEASKYISTEKRGKIYKGNVPQVKEAYVDLKKPFIFDMHGTTRESQNYERWRRARDGWKDTEYDKTKIYWGDIPTKQNRRAEAFVKQLKKEGYDGIISKDTIVDSEGRSRRGNNDEIAVFYNENIKTKSQLTDIYNQAVKHPTQPPTKIGKPKAVEEPPRITGGGLIKYGLKLGKIEGYGIGRKEARSEVIQRFNERILTTETAKSTVFNYIKKILEPQDRGKFLVMVRDAKTPKDVAKAFSRIDTYAQKQEIKQSITDLKKNVEKLSESPSVSVDYRNKIKDIIDQYELSGHTEKTLNKLKDTQSYIDSVLKKGEDVELPQRLLNKLKILTRIPKDQITLNQVEGLNNEIQLMGKLGKTKWASKQALYEAEKDIRKDQLLDTVVPIASKTDKKLPIGMSPRWYVNKYIKLRNYIQKSNIGLTPMDGIADLTGMHPMKAVMDLNYGNYLTYNDEAIKGWYELTENFNESNFNRIGAIAIAKQKGGLDRLANSGITQKEINDIELTPEEEKAYNYVVDKFNTKYPAVKKYAMDTYNADVGQIDNYVSFMSDYEAMSDLDIYDRFGVRPQEAIDRRTKTVEQGFTKERAQIAKYKIETDIDKIFRRHLDDVAYMLTMGKDIKQYFEIVNSPEMREKLGDVGTIAWLQWLDLMARKGGTDGAKRIAGLDIIRKNIGAGILSFRLSSALVQFSSFADTLATLGETWATKGAVSIATSRQWRDFIIDNFPEVRKAIGDDIAFREFGDTLLGKYAKAGLKPLQVLDGIMRSVAASGAYQKVATRRGIVVDLTKPNKQLIQEATKLMRQSQGSSFFKDQPLAITAGYGLLDNKTANKLILTFQSFMLNRWDNIKRQVYRLGIKEKDYKKAIGSLFWLIVFASAMEEGMRRGSRKIINMITGDEQEEKPVVNNMALNVVQSVPIMGQVVSAMTYSSNPVPVINTFDEVISGMATVVKGKKPLTKAKGGVRFLGALGSLLGIAGSSQMAQIIRKAISVPTESADTDTISYEGIADEEISVDTIPYE